MVRYEFARLWPTYPILGTITSGSAIITAVGRIDGYAGFLGGDVAVNDLIWQSAFVKSYFPLGAKINAFDGAAGTITMSANAIASAVALPLNYWVRA